MTDHKKAAIDLWMCCLAPVWFYVPHLFGTSDDSPLQFIALVVIQPFILLFTMQQSVDNFGDGRVQIIVIIFFYFPSTTYSASCLKPSSQYQLL